MQNFETKISLTEKTLNNIRGIFDKNNVKIRLIEFEEKLLQENFWKDKNQVKKIVKQKKVFEDILNFYQKTSLDISNIKDLFNLASQEKN